MYIRPIWANSDYEAALDQIASLIDSDPLLGRHDGDRLDVPPTLVQAYEARHRSVPPPDPIRSDRGDHVLDGATGPEDGAHEARYWSALSGP
jgi:antitoxin component HigA of HigAB toxin-antitoxin module